MSPPKRLIGRHTSNLPVRRAGQLVLCNVELLTVCVASIDAYPNEVLAAHPPVLGFEAECPEAVAWPGYVSALFYGKITESGSNARRQANREIRHHIISFIADCDRNFLVRSKARADFGHKRITAGFADHNAGNRHRGRGFGGRISRGHRRRRRRHWCRFGLGGGVLRDDRGGDDPCQAGKGNHDRHPVA